MVLEEVDSPSHEIGKHVMEKDMPLSGASTLEQLLGGSMKALEHDIER